MAFPDDLPARTDESIGRTKVNTGTYSNTSTQADAGEYNRHLDTTIAIATSLGLPDGSTASSAWQAILGGAAGQQQLLATGVIDAAAAVLHVFMWAPGQQVSTTGTGFAGRRLVIVVHESSLPCSFVATGGSIVGEEGNSITLFAGCVYLATDISGGLQWSVVRIDADEAYDHLTTLQAESAALEARLDDLDAGVVSTIPTLTTGSGAGSYVYGGPVIYASGTGWSRELLTLDDPVQDRSYLVVYLGTPGQSITLITTGANTLNGSAASSYVVHGGSVPRIVHVTSKGGTPTEHKVVEFASYAEADALDTRLDAIEANEWVTLVRIAPAVKSAAQGVESLRQIYTSTPAAIGTAAPGSSVLAAAGDHVHAHGSQTDGTHHAAAIAGGASGFMTGTQVTAHNQLNVGDVAANVVATAKTASTFTVGASEVFIKLDTTSNAIAATAPSPSVAGRRFTLKKISTDANAITLVQSGSEQIEGTAATYTCPGSTFANKPAWTFESDGTNWFLV